MKTTREMTPSEYAHARIYAAYIDSLGSYRQEAGEPTNLVTDTTDYLQRQSDKDRWLSDGFIAFAAKQLGCNRMKIWRWHHGKAELSLNDLAHLAETFRLGVRFLVFSLEKE